MADGFSTTFANSLLNALTNTAPTAYSGGYALLHTGAPGSAGTANTSVATTTRVAATFSTASAGALALSNTPSWTNGTGGTATSETITDISVWSAATAGTFLFSAALSASKAWASGDTLQLSSLAVSIPTAS